MKCSICGGDIDPHRLADGTVYWDQGHNAQPVNDGRCCDSCNTLVLAKRIREVFPMVVEAQHPHGGEE